jgi:alpha-amylase
MLLFTGPQSVLAKSGMTADPISLLAKEEPGFWAGNSCGYQVFIRSFSDSDSDGIGDLDGILERLDYLNDGKPGGNDLEIDFIWINPFFPSPSYHKYNTTDYYKVDSEYGSLEDFKKLAQECHNRDMKVIVDLIINHCDRTHPFFQSAVSSRNSDKRDWFLFYDSIPDLKLQRGTMVETPTGYYFANFSDFPEFNMRNPEVIQYFVDVARFWLDAGADGFRLDALRHLVEIEHKGVLVANDAPENIDVIKQFSDAIRESHPEAFLIGEIWSSPAVISRFTNPKRGGLHGAFNFSIRGKLLALENISATRFANDYYNSVKFNNDMAIDVIFSGNHDLPRLANKTHALDALKLKARVFFLHPGTPIVYNGDELGMLKGEKVDPNHADLAFRTIMPWDSSEMYGFTTGKKAWNKFSPDSENRNVETALKDQNSLYYEYKNLIELRKKLPGYTTGTYVPHPCGKKVMTFFVKSYRNTYLTMINIGKEVEKGFIQADRWTTTLKSEGKISVTEVVGPETGKTRSLKPGKNPKTICKMQPGEYRIFRVSID